VELVQRYSKLPSIARFRSSTPTGAVPIERTDRSSHRVHNVRKRLGPETITRLVADYQTGMPSTALTKKYGIAKGTVLVILNEAGVTRKQCRLTTAQLNEAAELYEQGWSLVRLGERFGFDQSTLWVG
jgi:hypothetical protein